VVDTVVASSALRRQVNLTVLVSLLVMLVAASAFGMTAANYQILLVNNALIAALGAMALNVVMGLAGLVTVGNAAILALGAYGAAFFGLQQGLPMPAVLLVVAVVGALIGLVIGFPALRVHGIYLAIVTLALHFIAVWALTEYQLRENVGASGFLLPYASIFGHPIKKPIEWYILLVVATVACFLGIHNLKNGKFGRAWLLIHHHPLIAVSQGISLGRYRVLAFVFSSSLIATSGVLLAYFQQVVYIGGFSLDVTIQYIAMIIIGGLGSPGGAIAGAFFVSLLPTFLNRLIDALPENGDVAIFFRQNLGDLQLIIYGSCVVLFLLFEPRGFAGVGRRITARLRRQRAPELVEA
jgi:branched-chain amino acid transport system permease protein